jgi:hypothetical protein
MAATTLATVEIAKRSPAVRPASSIRESFSRMAYGLTIPMRKSGGKKRRNEAVRTAARRPSGSVARRSGRLSTGMRKTQRAAPRRIRPSRCAVGPRSARRPPSA